MYRIIITHASLYMYRRHYTEGAPFDSGLRPRQKDTSLTPTPSPTPTSAPSPTSTPVPYSYNMHDPTTVATRDGEGGDDEDADARSDVSNKSVHSTIEPAGNAEDTSTHNKTNTPKRHHKHSKEEGRDRRKSSVHSRK